MTVTAFEHASKWSYDGAGCTFSVWFLYISIVQDGRQALDSFVFVTCASLGEVAKKLRRGFNSDLEISLLYLVSNHVSRGRRSSAPRASSRLWRNIISFPRSEILFRMPLQQDPCTFNLFHTACPGLPFSSIPTV